MRNEAGIALATSPNSVIRENTGGLFLRDSADAVVEHNRFISEWTPVMLLNSQRATFTDNAVTGELQVSGTHGSVIARNLLEAMDTRMNGIALYGALDNLVERNVLSGYRGASAIYVLGHDNRIARNRFENSLYGVRLVASHRNVVVRNSLVRNGVGLYAEDRSDDNLVSRNRISGSEDGIVINPEQTGNVLERNSSDYNGDDGFDIRSPGTTLAANSANRNRDLGIEAVAGVIDRGGNRAFGNGNPLQCLNVACK